MKQEINNAPKDREATVLKDSQTEIMSTSFKRKNNKTAQGNRNYVPEAQETIVSVEINFIYFVKNTHFFKFKEGQFLSIINQLREKNIFTGYDDLTENFKTKLENKENWRLLCLAEVAYSVDKENSNFISSVEITTHSGKHSVEIKNNKFKLGTIEIEENSIKEKLFRIEKISSYKNTIAFKNNYQENIEDFHDTQNELNSLNREYNRTNLDILEENIEPTPVSKHPNNKNLNLFNEETESAASLYKKSHEKSVETAEIHPTLPALSRPWYFFSPLFGITAVLAVGFANQSAISSTAMTTALITSAKITAFGLAISLPYLGIALAGLALVTLAVVYCKRNNIGLKDIANGFVEIIKKCLCCCGRERDETKSSSSIFPKNNPNRDNNRNNWLLNKESIKFSFDAKS